MDSHQQGLQTNMRIPVSKKHLEYRHINSEIRGAEPLTPNCTRYTQVIVIKFTIQKHYQCKRSQSDGNVTQSVS